MDDTEWNDFGTKGYVTPTKAEKTTIANNLTIIMSKKRSRGKDMAFEAYGSIKTWCY